MVLLLYIRIYLIIFYLLSTEGLKPPDAKPSFSLILAVESNHAIIANIFNPFGVKW